MTHADGYFAIGKTHTVCQDYVRHGNLPNGMAYAIVSDGCSSSKDTDIGARILVCMAERYLQGIPEDPDEIRFDLVIEMARLVVKTMCGLDCTCLDATLLIAIETKTQILVFKMGDGVVSSRLRDGSWEYEYHEFTSGAPYYPNYLGDEPRRFAYMAQANDPVVYNIGGSVTNKFKHTSTVDDHIANMGMCSIYNKSDVDLVVLMTDGACSFRSGLEPVMVHDIVKQIVDVKATAGEFMVRRAKRFLGSYCATQGWHHDDDFGVGAIFVDEAC